MIHGQDLYRNVIITKIHVGKNDVRKTMMEEKNGDKNSKCKNSAIYDIALLLRI